MINQIISDENAGMPFNMTTGSDGTDMMNKILDALQKVRYNLHRSMDFVDISSVPIRGVRVPGSRRGFHGIPGPDRNPDFLAGNPGFGF